MVPPVERVGQGREALHLRTHRTSQELETSGPTLAWKPYPWMLLYREQRRVGGRRGAPGSLDASSFSESTTFAAAFMTLSSSSNMARLSSSSSSESSESSDEPGPSSSCLALMILCPHALEAGRPGRRRRGPSVHRRQLSVRAPGEHREVFYASTLARPIARGNPWRRIKLRASVVVSPGRHRRRRRRRRRPMHPNRPPNRRHPHGTIPPSTGAGTRRVPPGPSTQPVVSAALRQL